VNPVVTSEDVAWFRVEEPSASGAVRRSAMRVADEVGFDEERAGEVGIVATELSTNLVKHASAGRVVVRRVRHDGRAGVELVSVDAGPGLADLALSALDGHSTTGTLGIGLGAVRRLSSSCDAHSVPGRGTVLVATLFVDGPDQPSAVATMTRPMNGEDVCGDAAGVRIDDGRSTLLLADGLGHGPLAATAANEAVRLFLAGPPSSPATLLEAVHRGIRHTRGAAVAVAEIDREAGSVRFAGVGNVAAWIDGHERRQGMVSHPGIVGAQARSIREQVYDLPDDGLVVLHSDGLTDKWDLADAPGLRFRSAGVIAASVLRDAGVRHDDASVVVAA
jgi:anti-sigma regulatory factor (Ser/Thr protein kinase)